MDSSDSAPTAGTVRETESALIGALEERTRQLQRANLALQQDIAQRERAEQALHERERELRALAEALPQMVWMTGPDGKTLFVNQRWIDYAGPAGQGGQGEGWIAAYHPDDRARALQAWQQAVDGVADYNIECRLRRVDGSYRWMLVRSMPLRDAGGQVTKWLGTCTDIDGLKRAEQAARTSEREQRRLALELAQERARLLAAQAVAKVGSWETDLATLQVTWSTETHRIFGTAPESFEPTHQRFLERVHPEDRDAVEQAFQRSALEHARCAIEHRLPMPDGRITHVEERWEIAGGGATGEPLRAIGTCQDITERVGLQERLRESQRLESVGQLTGGVAHDFNNLLTVILGNAEVLHGQLRDNPRLAPLADMIVSAAERGADLTRRLLAFARKQALAPQAVDVGARVSAMEALLRRTLGEHVRIGFTQRTVPGRALVDPAQLDNALLNLCLNARDAMPGGGRLAIETAGATLDEAYARGHADVRAGAYVMLSVADSGIGIAPEHLARVFEPFFTTKEKGKGTGLGLAMIYGFVKQSGGHVAIGSEPGQGTTVRLYLPLAPEAADPAPLVPAAQAAGGSESVLLVEDAAPVRRYARDQLVALGYRVTEAQSGAHALEILRGGAAIDLLFTDVVMPGMSGRELAVQAAALRPRMKVLYTSGYSEDAIIHQGRLDAGVHLLAKPYRRDELARRVRAALQAPA